MSTPVRVAGFVVGLLAVFALAAGVGRAVGPIDVEASPAGHGMAGSDDAMSGMEDMAAVGALESTQGGYTLALDRPVLDAGHSRLAFTVTGPDGAPVTAYDVEHERRLHLIVVRRDLTGFQHLHPTLDRATGVWSTRADLAPGVWRVIADFTPAGGDPLTLGEDLSVPGRFTPTTRGAEDRTSRVDGYTVDLAGDLMAGQESRLVLTVSRHGRTVTDLQPYLGAYGHLVALRAGDLGYLHVHPDGAPGEVPAGPDVVFHADVPSRGGYRLFLDFRHGGAVHTAAFTVRVPEGGAS